MKHASKLAVLIAGCVVPIVGIISSASAADNVTRQTLTFPAEAVAACEGGVEVGLGFDIVRNVHEYSDSTGTVVLIRRNVNFVGIFSLMGTDRTVTFQGARIVTQDLVTGTFTSVGNYRTLTQPGDGIVFHSAGREVFDENFDLVFSAGPKYDELSPGAQSDICGLFGLQAA
jgi:hypothetical protein